MRWHNDKRVKIEDVLRHQANAEGWKHFDCEFPKFASDSWNVHLGLPSNGFNPFRNMITLYSMCPYGVNFLQFFTLKIHERIQLLHIIAHTQSKIS